MINKKFPVIISLNNLTGEKASAKKLRDPKETSMNAKTPQKYNVINNFNINFMISLKLIYTLFR